LSRVSAVGRSFAPAVAPARRSRAFSARRRSAPVSHAAADGAAADAVKALKAACDAVADEMKGVSVTFVGDNEQANLAVAKALAKALGYTPLSTPALIEQVTDSTREAILKEDGVAGLVLAENAVLEQLSTMIRCCVATSGGGKGAAARGDCWDYIFGQFTVWLDDVEAVQRAKNDPDASPQRDAYAFAEARLVLSSTEVKTELEAANIGVGVMSAIRQLIEGDPQLSGKKGFYVKMGCRGDWPVLQPPGWDGTEEGKIDPATQKPYREGSGTKKNTS
jgi:shikimate kinase